VEDGLASFQGRDLSRKRYVYLWAEDIYFNVRLEGAKQGILVTVGVSEDSHKKLVGSPDG
jgi:transposase-like protein